MVGSCRAFLGLIFLKCLRVLYRGLVSVIPASVQIEWVTRGLNDMGVSVLREDKGGGEVIDLQVNDNDNHKGKVGDSGSRSRSRVDVEWDFEKGTVKPLQMKVHDPKVFGSLLRDYSLDFLEDYVAGLWDCDDLDEFFLRALRSMAHNADHWLHCSIRHSLQLQMDSFSPQSSGQNWANAKAHYDFGKIW
jgi:hypothetical protein